MNGIPYWVKISRNCCCIRSNGLSFSPAGHAASFVSKLHPRMGERCASMGVFFHHDRMSPVPAQAIADLELDERVYAPDFEITARYQSFSKELVRISLLGLGVYGFLIKTAADEPGSEHMFLRALRNHPVVAAVGIIAFATCAACGLIHGFLATRCLGYQLVISRYLTRLEGSRWTEAAKVSFRDVIKERQIDQEAILRLGNSFLLAATIALIGGAGMVAFSLALEILGK